MSQIFAIPEELDTLLITNLWPNKVIVVSYKSLVYISSDNATIGVGGGGGGCLVEKFGGSVWTSSENHLRVPSIDPVPE